MSRVRWNEDIDSELRILQPVGLPLVIITISSIFLFFSIAFAAIRSQVRYKDGVFGWDDGLMVAGAVSSSLISRYVEALSSLRGFRA